MIYDKLNKILYDTIGSDGLEVVNKILTNISIVYTSEPINNDSTNGNINEINELRKSVYKQYGVATINVLDLVLPLIVVPRSILAWLIVNVKPLKIGESKELLLPGGQKVKLIAEKLDNDLYNITFIKDGHIIHKSVKQTLPNIGIHILSLTELYELIIKEEHDRKKIILPESFQAQPKESDNTSTKLDGIKFLLNLYNYKDLASQTDMSIFNTTLKSLITTIEKLVDVLVTNHLSKSTQVSLKSLLPDIFKKPDKLVNIKPKSGKEIISKLLKRKKPESPYTKKLSVEDSGIATTKQLYYAALNSKMKNKTSQSLNKLLNKLSKQNIKDKIIVKSLDHITCDSCGSPLLIKHENDISINRCPCCTDIINHAILSINKVDNGFEIQLNKKAPKEYLQYLIEKIRGE